MTIVLWILLGLPLALLAVIGLRYLVRGTPVSRVRVARYRGEAPGVRDPSFRQSVEHIARVRLVPGHTTELFSCGDELYPRMFADLRAAERSITLQLYYCKPGRLADELQRVLLDRARAGVRILFLQDAFGSLSLDGAYNDTLRQAGATVAQFRPVRWYDLEKAYNRSHIRVVTIDAAVGYTGGFGVDDKWSGDGRTAGEWRDTAVRFEGAAVAHLQAVFAAGWAEATGDLITGDLFFPPPEHVFPGEGVQAGVLHAAPTIGSTVAERFLALVIAGATERLWITNAYFVPPEDFCELLGAAARRGVDVRVLTAGTESDVQTTTWAGRARYEALLSAGVRIYEYAASTLHAKTLVVDGCFAAVGTMNFDNRSMAFNDETQFVAYDGGFAREMEALFLADLPHAREITLPEWRARGWRSRALERGASLLSRVL